MEPFCVFKGESTIVFGAHKQIVKRSSKLLAHASHAQKPVQRQLVATIPQIYQDAGTSSHNAAEDEEEVEEHDADDDANAMAAGKTKDDDAAAAAAGCCSSYCVPRPLMTRL